MSQFNVGDSATAGDATVTIIDLNHDEAWVELANGKRLSIALARLTPIPAVEWPKEVDLIMWSDGQVDCGERFPKQPHSIVDRRTVRLDGADVGEWERLVNARYYIMRQNQGNYFWAKVGTNASGTEATFPEALAAVREHERREAVK